MTSKAFLFLMPVFLFCMSLHNGTDYFFAERAGVMWLILGLIILKIWQLYGVLVGTFAGYIGFSLIYAVFWLDNQFSGMGDMRPIIQRACLVGAFSTLACFGAVWLKPVSRAALSKCFLAFGILICVHFWVFKHWYQPEGFLMTPTLAGVYLVLCLPLIRGEAWPLFAVFSITVLATGGHACALALACYLTGVFWVNRPKWLKVWLPSLFGAVGLVWAIRGTSWLIRDHGRAKVWRVALDFWEGSGHRTFGLGSGTWYSLVPAIQKSTNTLDQGLYGSTYAHNECIQILFELGWVGLALALAFWFVSVVRSKANGDFRSVGFLFALAGSSVSMFPLRSDALLFLVAFSLYDLLENQFKRA